MDASSTNYIIRGSRLGRIGGKRPIVTRKYARAQSQGKASFQERWIRFLQLLISCYLCYWLSIGINAHGGWSVKGRNRNEYADDVCAGRRGKVLDRIYKIDRIKKGAGA